MASIRYVATDIDRSVEFYRDRLGFSVDMHNPDKNAALVREDALDRIDDAAELAKPAI